MQGRQAGHKQEASEGSLSISKLQPLETEVGQRKTQTTEEEL